MFEEPDLGGVATAKAYVTDGDPADRKVFKGVPLLGKAAPVVQEAPPAMTSRERKLKWQAEQGPPTVGTCKGRWGWYPCNWTHWKNLKRLNFLLDEHFRRVRIRQRQEAKQPWNRDERQLVVLPHWNVMAPVAAKVFVDYFHCGPVQDEDGVVKLELTPLQVASMLDQLETWYSGPKTVKVPKPAKPG